MPLTAEQNTFLIEAYFRTGTVQQNGEWVYNIQGCADSLLERFADIEMDQEYLWQNIRRIVKRFRVSGSVHTGKSPGRNKVLTNETLQDIRQRMEQSPTKSLKQLAAQTGILKNIFSYHKLLSILYLQGYLMVLVTRQ